MPMTTKTQMTGTIDKIHILWKATKCLSLVPWLKAAGDIPASTFDEDAALDLMDWPDEKIDETLASLGIGSVPKDATGLSLPIFGVANAFISLLDRRDKGMVTEAALVFDKEGKTMVWHIPEGSSAGSIPDSRSLWEFLMENKDRIGGVAHTHPWEGAAWPSSTDVTTFSAIERGLGKRFVWPVVTFSEIKSFVWVGPDLYDYGLREETPPIDANGLRERSRRI